MNSIKYFLSGLIFFCYLNATGQSDSSKCKNYATIQLNIGIGIPFSPPTDRYYGGLVLSSYDGYIINLAGTIPVKHSNWGLEGMINYGGNEFNKSGYSWYQSFSVSNGGYYNELSSMLGVFLTIPLGKTNQSLCFRLLGGALYFKVPGLIYSGILSYGNPLGYGYVSGTWVESPENNISFAWDIGTSLKSMLTKRFFGELNFDMFYSNLNGGLNSSIQFTDAKTGQKTNTPSEAISDVSLFNITVTIGYIIGH